MSNQSNISQRLRRQPLWLWAVAVAVALLALYMTLGRQGPRAVGTTFVVRRGTLPINVLDGGSAEALESQEIRSQIKGYQGTKILSIVEEGYLVTDEDVRKGKVLVELDSSDLQVRITTQEITYQSTLSSLIEAQQAYDIQKNQNASDLIAAEQKARFALMDFEKFMGKTNTMEIIDLIGLKLENFTNSLEEAEAELDMDPSMMLQQIGQPNTNKAAGDLVGATPDPGLPIPERAAQPSSVTNVAALAAAAAPPKAVAMPSRPAAGGKTNGETAFAPAVNFIKYAKVELLGDGAARQQFRKLEDDYYVSQQAYDLAKIKYEGTKRLFDQKFATKMELDSDSLTIEQNKVKLASARTAMDLNMMYEFTRTAEDFLSKYDESLRLLVRARKEAISKLAQARARKKSAEGRFRIESQQMRELKEQMGNCVIRAKRQGLVVYGGGEDRHFGNEEPIREGATVRERQTIITIPDMTKMSVRLKIHESNIKKVKKGLKAKIHVDAFPDQTLEGEVFKVGVLPDSANRWMNPDLKVYITSVAINGVYEWLKPGMSAKVEIQVKDLPDVVFVPLQAVVPINGKHYAFVENGVRSEQREIEAGEFNDEFIEIKKGLKEGEKVLLRAPEGTETGGDGKGDDEDKESGVLPAKPAGAKPAAAAPATPPAGGGAKPAGGTRAPRT